MVSELREKKKKKPNYFWFIHESILGNLSVTVFHSGHLPHLLKLSDQPYHRQKTLTPYHRQSPFLTPTIPSSAQGENLQVLSKHRRENLSHVPTTHVSSPAAWTSHASAWSTFRQRASTSNLAWRRLATLHLCLCHPSPANAFVGVFVSTSPLDNLSGDLRWLPLNPEPCTCLRKYSSTLPVVPHLFFFTIWYLTIADPRFFFFQPRSKAVLGLFSIQTYFILQISRYGY